MFKSIAMQKQMYKLNKKNQTNNKGLDTNFEMKVI